MQYSTITVALQLLVRVLTVAAICIMRIPTTAALDLTCVKEIQGKETSLLTGSAYSISFMTALSGGIDGFQSYDYNNMGSRVSSCKQTQPHALAKHK